MLAKRIKSQRVLFPHDLSVGSDVARYPEVKIMMPMFSFVYYDLVIMV